MVPRIGAVVSSVETSARLSLTSVWGLRTIRSGRFLTTVAVTVAGMCVVALFSYSLSLSLADFNAYFQAGSEWLRGVDPYNQYLRHNLDVPAGFRGGFIYPPYTLPFFGALALLGKTWAARLWVTGEMLALGGLILMLAEKRTPRRLAVCTVFVLFFLPTASSFAYAQIGPLVLAGAWLALELDRRDRPRAAGIVLGLAGMTKLFPFFTVVSFIARRRLAAAVVAAAVVVAASALSWPWTNHYWSEFFHGIILSKSQPSPSLGNQSIAAMVARLVLNDKLASVLEMLLPLLLAAGMIAVGWLGRRRDDRLGYALLLASLPLIVPNGLQHYYIFALPLMWILLTAGVAQRSRGLCGVVLLAEFAFSVIPATSSAWLTLVGHVSPWLLQVPANSSVLGGLLVCFAGARHLLRPTA